MRLGRYVEHDARSFGYPARMVTQPVSVSWERHTGPFDQGNVGSCTGNAMAGAKMTGNLWTPGMMLTETEAIALYSRASELDNVPGSYPPTDTGSSGLAVAKAAKEAGYISSYRHAFGRTQALNALAQGPVIIGINWYAGFDSPRGRNAALEISGIIRGGHEVVLDGIDFEAGVVFGTNSWGNNWGNHGKFCMGFGTFGTLLRQDGDVVVPLA